MKLTKDEQARCNKHKANQRKEELKAIEDNAKHLVKLADKIVAGQKDLLQRYGAIKILYEEAKPLVESVLYGFAHLPKGEKIMGHTKAAEWAKAEMGCTYEWLRRLRNPKPDKLLIENSDAESAIDVTFKVVEPVTPAPTLATKEPEPTTIVINAKSLAAMQDEGEALPVEAEPPTATDIVGEVMNRQLRARSRSHFPRSAGAAFRRSGTASQAMREDLLSRNPEAILLGEEFDPALVGIVHPIYVHHPDVFVAAYDMHKIDAILWEQMKLEYPGEDDEYGLSVECAEAYWQLLDFQCGNDQQRKHLPVVIEVIEARPAEKNS